MQLTCQCNETYNVSDGVNQFRCIKCKTLHQIASPADKRQSPTPWPLWTKPIALLMVESDRGIGDTIQRHLHLFGAILKMTGVACGCQRRAEHLNELYPNPKHCYTEQQNPINK